MKLLSTQHHQNGIIAKPFQVSLFEDDDRTIKVSIDFGKNRFAVLQLDKLSNKDIMRGSNSWNGDYYKDQVRGIVAEAFIKLYKTSKSSK